MAGACVFPDRKMRISWSSNPFLNILITQQPDCRACQFTNSNCTFQSGCQANGLERGYASGLPRAFFGAVLCMSCALYLILRVEMHLSRQTDEFGAFSEKRSLDRAPWRLAYYLFVPRQAKADVLLTPVLDPLRRGSRYKIHDEALRVDSATRNLSSW